MTGNTYTGPPQDVWALGILLYTLLHKENPFYSVQEVVARQLKVPTGRYSPESDAVLVALLCKDVEKRMTLQQLQRDAWYTSD